MLYIGKCPFFYKIYNSIIDMDVSQLFKAIRMSA